MLDYYDNLNDSNDSGQDQTINSIVNPEFPPDLTADQRQDLDNLLDKYAGLLSSKPGLTNLGTHKILVKPTMKPVKCHPYRIYPSKHKVMRDKINSLLDLGLIRPSESCFASPCMIVDKTDGGHRLVVNYSKLNSQCECQTFPIPRIDDLT